MNRNLIKELDFVRRKHARQLTEFGRVRFFIGQNFRQLLRHRNAVQQNGQILHRLRIRQAAGTDFVGHLHDLFRLMVGQGAEQMNQCRRVNRTEHLAH